MIMLAVDITHCPAFDFFVIVNVNSEYTSYIYIW